MTERRLSASSRLILLPLFLMLAGVTLGAPADVFESYLQLEPYGEPVPARAPDGGPLTLSVGHLELKLTDGVLHAVRSSTGHTVGWYFRGSGRYVYRTEDPADQALLADNLQRAGGRLQLRPGADSFVYDDLSELLILRAGFEFDELSGSIPPAAAAPADGATRRGFDAMWNGIQVGDLEFVHYAAATDANGPPDRYVYTEIVGSLERVAHVYDRHRYWIERLLEFRKFNVVDIRFDEWLSTQVIPGREQALNDLRLNHADLKVVTPDNKTGTISGRLSLQAARDGLRIGELALINNRDPKSDRWQSQRNALRLTEVTDGQGRQLEFSHRYNELAIDFGRPLALGEEVSVEFAADAAIFTDSDGVHADNYRDLSLIDWFPQPISPGGRRFTFTLDVRCKPPFVPVVSGNTVFQGQEDGLNVVRSSSDVPAWLVSLFLGKYAENEQTFGDLTTKVHGYGLSRKPDLEHLGRLTAVFTEFFGKTLGPYPSREIDLVELNTLAFFGVSPSGVIILTSRTFEPKNEVMREYLGNRGVNAMLAHEVAHQWFGHKAWPSDPLLDNWLTESLAEYAAGLAMGVAEQHMTGVGRTHGFRSMHAEWWRYAREVAGRGSIRSANRIEGPLAWFYRFDLLYNRGPLVLHQLRTLIGDERFNRILTTFLGAADYGPVDTGDFVAATNEVLGQDFAWYFDQWLNQSGIPEIEVEKQVVTRDGRTLLVGQVRQSGDEFFKIHVPLVLEFPGGSPQVRLVFQEQRTQSFEFELPAAPSKVLVDPAHNTLAEYR